MKVPADVLRSVLGISTVTRTTQDRALAIVDSSLAGGVAAARKISIGNFTFAPANLEVPAGTSILWVNEDDVPHTVTGTDKDSPVRSPALDTGDRYATVLTEPGTYRYFCSLHPHMTGVVVVSS